MIFGVKCFKTARGGTSAYLHRLPALPLVVQRKYPSLGGTSLHSRASKRFSHCFKTP